MTVITTNRGPWTRWDPHSKGTPGNANTRPWLASCQGAARRPGHGGQATQLLSSGNDLAAVADCMGHANTNTTRIYDRRGESFKLAAVATLAVPYVSPGK